MSTRPSTRESDDGTVIRRSNSLVKVVEEIVSKMEKSGASYGRSAEDLKEWRSQAWGYVDWTTETIGLPLEEKESKEARKGGHLVIFSRDEYNTIASSLRRYS